LPLIREQLEQPRGLLAIAFGQLGAAAAVYLGSKGLAELV
jgi:hypothetical protein